MLSGSSPVAQAAHQIRTGPRPPRRRAGMRTSVRARICGSSRQKYVSWTDSASIKSSHSLVASGPYLRR